MINANEKVMLFCDSRLSQVFGQSADPRNLFGKQITNICPVDFQTFGSPGQRMSRLPPPQGALKLLSFVDFKDCIIFAHGFFEHVKCVVISLDYNDYCGGNSQSLSNYQSCLREVIHYFQDIQIPNIVVISALSHGALESIPNPGGFYLNDFRLAAENICLDMGVIFCDGTSLVPDDEVYFHENGPHMTDAGHVLAAQNFVNFMQAQSVFPSIY